jgi:hypothetical protein
MILLVIGFALGFVVGVTSWLATAVWLETRRKSTRPDQGLDPQEADVPAKSRRRAKAAHCCADWVRLV